MLALDGLYLPTGDGDDDDARWATTWASSSQSLDRSLRRPPRHGRRPSYTHTAAPVLGPRAATHGVAANPGPSVDASSTGTYRALKHANLRLSELLSPLLRGLLCMPATPYKYSTLSCRTIYRTPLLRFYALTSHIPAPRRGSLLSAPAMYASRKHASDEVEMTPSKA